MGSINSFVHLMGLHPILPAPLPDPTEELSRPNSSKSTTEGDLFSLVGDPQVIFDDLLRTPEKYEAGVDVLLQELILGSKSLNQLSRQDRDLLNRSVIDLNRNYSNSPESLSHPEHKTTSNYTSELVDKMPGDSIPSDDELDLSLDFEWFNQT